MADNLFRVDNQVVLPSGEQADFSYWLSDTSSTLAGSITAVVQFANTVYNTLSANTAFKALYSSTVSFTPPKCSQVDLATGQIISVHPASSSFIGTSISNSLPPQLAVCVSLRTDLSGGRFRGRFYLPAPATTTIAANGRIVTANVSTFANGMALAFAAAITSSPTSLLVVYSRVGRSVRLVQSLDVGDVMDTQRRRRDKLVEVRVSSFV